MTKTTKVTTKPKVKSDPIVDYEGIGFEAAGSSELLLDQLTQLEKAPEVQEILAKLEKGLKNAEIVKTWLREEKKKKGVKSLERYIGHYDIAIPGTISDITDDDTETASGKSFVRVFSSSEIPRNNPYQKGGAQIFLRRGTSITQTKGQRYLQSVIMPDDILRIISFGENPTFWHFIVACSLFNRQMIVDVPSKIGSSATYPPLETLEEIKF